MCYPIQCKGVNVNGFEHPSSYERRAEKSHLLRSYQKIARAHLLPFNYRRFILNADRDFCKYSCVRVVRAVYCMIFTAPCLYRSTDCINSPKLPVSYDSSGPAPLKQTFRLVTLLQQILKPKQVTSYYISLFSGFEMI